VRVDRDVDAVTNWEEGVEPCNEGWMAMEKARDALDDAWSIYSVETIMSEKKKYNRAWSQTASACYDARICTPTCQ